MDDIDLARALFGAQRGGERVQLGQPHTFFGTATNTPSSGPMSVVLPGESVTGDGVLAVPIHTTEHVRSGDSVQVTVANGSALVTGVIGRGDEVADGISAAREAAAAASSRADELAEEVGDVKVTVTGLDGRLGSLGTRVEGIARDAGDALSAATEARQTATEVSSTANRALTTAEDSLTQSSDVSQTAASLRATVEADYLSKSAAGETYAAKTELTQTAASLEALISEAKGDAQALSTLIRATADGVEVGRTDDGKTYNSARALVGADGDFRVRGADGADLATFASALVSLCGGRGSVEYRKDYFATGSDAFVISADALVNVMSTTGMARLLASPGDLKSHGAAQVSPKHVSLGTGDGASDQFGSGCYVDLTDRQVTIKAATLALVTGGLTAAVSDWVSSRGESSVSVSGSYAGTAKARWSKDASGWCDVYVAVRPVVSTPGEQTYADVAMPFAVRFAYLTASYVGGGVSWNSSKAPYVETPAGQSESVTAVRVWAYPADSAAAGEAMPVVVHVHAYWK